MFGCFKLTYIFFFVFWNLNFDEYCTEGKLQNRDRIDIFLLQALSRISDKLLLTSSCFFVLLSALPPVPWTNRIPQNGFPWNLIWLFWRKSVRKIKLSLRYNKNNSYFTWRPLYSFHHILLGSSYNEKNFQICL